MTVVKEKLKTELIPYSQEERYRLEKLAEKQDKKTFEVAFCGHFSAGKSTILNTLLGAEVLPTSPIPTSANIIGIKNGELGLTLHTKDGEQKQWKGEIPWTQVREWGMNGNEISNMVITAPLPFLGEHSCILDTPGVDSTDESHEAVTVDQLYTTDAIVYVMDYNHVQSETNLYFLKQLSLEKKPIYIIINQVDKHNEQEIPLSVFRQSVQDVFSRWEIRHLGLFFTTMKKPDHPLNQFKTFEKTIKSLLFHSDKLLNGSRLRLEQGFYQAVENRLQEDKLDAVDQLLDEMKEKGYEVSQLDEQQHLKTKLVEVRQYDKAIYKSFDDELGGLFKDVILFPYTTTDLARNWIESIQPGFKVGLLFTKKKTQEEQNERLRLLVQDLQDKVKSQLLFHVQAYFQKINRMKLTNVEELEAAINQLSFEVTDDLLKKNVKSDHASRDYVFAFSKEITSMIVRDIRNKAREIVDLQIEGLKEAYRVEQKSIETQLAKFKNIEKYVDQVNQVKADFDKNIEVVKEQIATYPPEREYNETIKHASNQSYPEKLENGFANVILPEEGVIDTSWEVTEEKSTIDFSEEETLTWLNSIKNVLHDHKDQVIVSHERNHLIERINRYENQTFIISLFGAFSAGKSSFANALLGENILPVSPNPTTATVNTVEQSTADHAHGTAKVTVKSVDALNHEIRSVSEQLDESLDLERLSQWKPNMKDYVSSWQKTYAEYLLTIQQSVASTEWKLGSEFSVSHEEMQSLVAEESKACLIEKVNIYFDSAITKKGIILVDTPGVNSIHGRHTNVAFQQMRQSDAIFYLTYYNHAFSKADQYFLQQMGKVNESFGHDKLYFVINAADLASSEGELNGVRKHVYDQLRRNGIEKPRLYHLSSKEGLQAKKEQLQTETTFAAFERSFYEYTILELKQLSVKMITEELRQFTNKIKDSISFMNEEANEQKLKHEKLKQTVEIEIDNVHKASFSFALRDILMEFDQLVLYLRDRMRFVLNDYFASAINVAVLTGNSKKELHEQLTGAIKEWRGLGEYFLKQELEATVIRMEEKMKARAKSWLSDQITLLQKELPYLYCEAEIEIAAISVELNEMALSIDTKKYLPMLKSKKDFFENGAVKQFKELIVADGVENSREMINLSSKKMSNEFEQKLQTIEQDLKQRLKEAIENELNRFEALFDAEAKSALINEYDELKRFVY
ncbi:dynamin family protein [Alkalihalobacterium chitinilyticum]|uniref:Dynamin family protein n=1 Tax=Alkalihalobacterium chitinilyticum TaxID=2980103 RepID=A0ABT5V8V9_9BACI|nr:dynamin family protein [Alkalihalobacterium chitinilyticum]MDE5411880.1 dynamin family protein [Alkalihalobacterium chitinilyticum]